MGNCPAAMAEVVEGFSPGRIPSSWGWLERLHPGTNRAAGDGTDGAAGRGQRALFVHGERDVKYAKVSPTPV